MPMILDREHKVAVATVDGKKIADHFGSAPLFAVYTVGNGRVLDWEMRANRGGCFRDEDDTQAGCWELMGALLVATTLKLAVEDYLSRRDRGKSRADA